MYERFGFVVFLLWWVYLTLKNRVQYIALGEWSHDGKRRQENVLVICQILFFFCFRGGMGVVVCVVCALLLIFYFGDVLFEVSHKNLPHSSWCMSFFSPSPLPISSSTPTFLSMDFFSPFISIIIMLMLLCWLLLMLFCCWCVFDHVKKISEDLCKWFCMVFKDLSH